MSVNKNPNGGCRRGEKYNNKTDAYLQELPFCYKWLILTIDGAIKEERLGWRWENDSLVGGGMDVSTVGPGMRLSLQCI